MAAPIPTAPVILLVFNRPELTRRMLEQVRLAKPARLLVVADGPRPDHPADQEQCAKTRGLIDELVDWDARVLTNYAPTNMGLRRRVSSGLSWAFEQVNEAIVLEDDCVPEPTFFRFCSELLEHYREDTRMGLITGVNFQQQPFACSASYYFSKYTHCWGWASWGRAWKCFDTEMRHWPEFRNAKCLDTLFPDPAQARYWEAILDRVYSGKIKSWAYIWLYSCWAQSLLTITPKVNLVSNIGFDGQGTHCANAPSPYADMRTEPMTFPLKHPSMVTLNHAADSYTQQHVFGAAPSPARDRWRRLWRQFVKRGN